MLTFLQIARDTGRKLAILPKDAHLLKTVRLIGPQIPDIAQDDSLVIYQKTTASQYPDILQRNIFEDYKDKTVLADDVSSAQEQFILCLSFFDLNELPSLSPAPGSLYVYSSSEPHDEEQEIDFHRLHQWLRHFGFKGFGLSVEKNGEWQLPDVEKGLQASGHAYGTDLLALVQWIKPEMLIPIHSERPDLYIKPLSGNDISVTLPVVGKTIKI